VWGSRVILLCDESFSLCFFSFYFFSSSFEPFIRVCIIYQVYCVFVVLFVCCSQDSPIFFLCWKSQSLISPSHHHHKLIFSLNSCSFSIFVNGLSNPNDRTFISSLRHLLPPVTIFLFILYFFDWFFFHVAFCCSYFWSFWMLIYGIFACLNMQKKKV